MTKICLSLATIFLILLFSISCTSPPPRTVSFANVIEVIDGDTITIEGGQQVRYIGIDTPETYPEPQDFGIEAWQANRRLVEGKRVRLEKDISETDRHGRLLRYVFVNDTFVNAELVKEGLAEAITYSPDTKYQDQLEQMEAEAREAGRGMWAK